MPEKSPPLPDPPDDRRRPPKTKLPRREFCRQSLLLASALAGTEAAAQSASNPAREAESPGSWPTARQNRCLTGVQPLPGRMRHAPQSVAQVDFGRAQAAHRALPDGSGRQVSLVDGGLRCHGEDGRILWAIHPPGLNFTNIVTAEDIDGDGRIEIALMAGRPTEPLGAAVLVAADTGRLRFRYDLEPMSYWWTMQVAHFLPETTAKQFVICEHGYPPDAKFGYIVLFEFPKAGQPPQQRWRYDFDHYTCFPSLLAADVNRDGVKELCVECHSRMWILEARTGKVHQFLEWSVAPANIRSYGLVRFQDLNHDGWPDFFCIANFAQHHEVLLNDNGQLKRAWAHGWDNSVTTTKIATTWPEPPIADVDGDGRLEMIVSMYHAEAEPRWMIRLYDAVTGTLKATALDCIATQLTDIDGDGRAEILADDCTDPTRARIDGARLLKVTGAGCETLWRQEGIKSATPEVLTGDAATALRSSVSVETANGTRRLVWRERQVALIAPEPLPAPPATPRAVALPAEVGVSVSAPLVADVDGDGKREVIHFHQGKITLYRYERKRGLVAFATYPASDPPAIADVDGDGRLELIVGTAGPTIDPVVTVYKPGAQQAPLWQVTLKRPDRIGLPFTSSHTIYFQTGRFTGRKGHDLYVFVGTPLVRSLMLNGRDGSLLWERGEIPGIERYFAPTVNLASVWDVDGDGCDDLVFTCPDYYCVAHGPTGRALVGPAFPPNIFKQPSQGLYTLPAILPASSGEPLVCLIDGHYFRAGMSLRAEGRWFTQPVVGEARGFAEGFLQTREGRWLIGFGRQDGLFACLDADTGRARWTYPLDATASAVSACDINGDGVQEFVFGTSHGDLIALADRQGKPHLVWKKRLPASVGTPIIADVDDDGASEILVALGNGTLCLLHGA